MKRFLGCLALLVESQDEAKIASEILSEYLRSLAAVELAWVVFFLYGRKINSGIKPSLLKELAQEITAFDDWLFAACYEKSGDLIETISLVLPQPQTMKEMPLSELAAFCGLLQEKSDGEKKQLVSSVWDSLNHDERYFANKIICGSFRSPVSAEILLESLSNATGICRYRLADYLEDEWHADENFLSELRAQNVETAPFGPYPFRVSQILEQAPPESGFDYAGAFYQWEWKGLKAQLVKRAQELMLWSERGLVLNSSFPEIIREADLLPDGLVLEGHILAFQNAELLSEEDLQKRIALKNPGPRILSQIPVVFMASDLLEENGLDIRRYPALKRQERLDYVLSNRSKYGPDLVGQLSLFAPCRLKLSPVLRLSPALEIKSADSLVETLQLCRNMRVRGISVRAAASLPEGDESRTFVVKPAPRKAKLVLISVREITDFEERFELNLAAWHADVLVPLVWTKDDLNELDSICLRDFVRNNTIKRFGTVRILKPELIFELEFDELTPSNRHKCGFFLGTPRLLGLKRGAAIECAAKLSELKAAMAPERAHYL